MTYTQQLDGRISVVETVPARVGREMAEPLLSPKTGNRLQTIIRPPFEPTRVNEFAA